MLKDGEDSLQLLSYILNKMIVKYLEIYCC